MAITQRDILKHVDACFNSSEHEILFELENSIDHFLYTHFNRDNDTLYYFIGKKIADIYPNRRKRAIDHIIEIYKNAGWKIKLDDNQNLVFWT